MISAVNPAAPVPNGDPYRIALLNGGSTLPTHDMVRIFEGEGASSEFEAATFHSLEDLLGHLEAAAQRHAHVDAVVIGPGPQERLAAARSIREQDARVQIILLVPAVDLLRFRRAVLFNPLLGDVWTSDLEDDAVTLRTLVRDAAGSTRQRRGLGSTLDRMNAELRAPKARPELREQRLAASDRYLASLLTHAPDPIVSCDPEGRIVSWNDAAGRVFGHSFDDVLGMPFESLVSKRSASAIRHMLENATAGEAVHQRQIDCRRRNGSVFQGEVTLAPVYDDEGRHVGISIIARDVSARVREQRALKKATDRLELLVEELRARTTEAEAASRAKSDFLAALSHELRTPLQAVIGYAALMEGGITEPEAQAEQLGRIRSSADHLLALIEQLLELSRGGVTPIEMERRPLDLCAVVTEAVDAVRTDAESKGLDLSPPDCLDERLRHLTGDPVRVRQILFNLLSNAVKFTENGGVQIELAWAKASDGEAALVRIRDTGVGMSPEEIEQIFEPFFQVRTRSRQSAPGLGLGLAISRRLAEAMGGRLEVRSEPGEGTEFTVVLPASEGRER